jgi:hypothetical protein
MHYDMLHQSLEEHKLKWKGQDDPVFFNFRAPVDKEALQQSKHRANTLEDISDSVFPLSNASIPSPIIFPQSAARLGVRDAIAKAADKADQEQDLDDTQSVDYT